MDVQDSNGNILKDGDTIQPIKDLKVKGSSIVIKLGTSIKKIRLIEGNENEVFGKVDGQSFKLEVKYFKKRK